MLHFIKRLILRVTPVAITGSGVFAGFFAAAVVHALWMHRLWSISQFGTVNAADCDSWYFDRLTILQDMEFSSVSMFSDSSVFAIVGRADFVVSSVLRAMAASGAMFQLLGGATFAAVFGSLVLMAHYRCRTVAGVPATWRELAMANVPLRLLPMVFVLAIVVGSASWHVTAHYASSATPLVPAGQGAGVLWLAIAGGLALGGWCTRAACLTAAVNGTLCSHATKLCHRCHYPAPAAGDRCPECGKSGSDRRASHVPRVLWRECAIALATLVIVVFGAFAMPRSIIGRDAWSWLRLRSTTYQIDHSLLNLPYGVPTVLRFGTEEIVVTPVFVRAANDVTPLQHSDVEALFVCAVADGRPLALLPLSVAAPFPLQSESASLYGLYRRGAPELLGRFVAFRISHQPDELRRADLDASLRPLWKRSWLAVDAYVKAKDLRLLVPLSGVKLVHEPWW